MIIQKVECNDCGRIKEYEAPETLSEVVFRLLTGGKLVEYEWYVEQCYSCEESYDEHRESLYSRLMEGVDDDEEDALPF
jgi:hypothetical protein